MFHVERVEVPPQRPGFRVEVVVLVSQAALAERVDGLEEHLALFHGKLGGDDAVLGDLGEVLRRGQQLLVVARPGIVWIITADKLLAGDAILQLERPRDQVGNVVPPDLRCMLFSAGENHDSSSGVTSMGARCASPRWSF